MYTVFIKNGEVYRDIGEIEHEKRIVMEQLVKGVVDKLSSGIDFMSLEFEGEKVKFWCLVKILEHNFTFSFHYDFPTSKNEVNMVLGKIESDFVSSSVRMLEKFKEIEDSIKEYEERLN